jgi:AcrR family transcriptional regulator
MGYILTGTSRYFMAESAKAKRSEETREAIVNVCIRMFAERGFVSTSLDEIGRAAGITRARSTVDCIS